MDDKYTLAIVGLLALLVYGSVALICGYNGNISTLVISGIVGIVTGTIGYVAGKRL
jgi:hypothetical protein